MVQEDRGICTGDTYTEEQDLTGIRGMDIMDTMEIIRTGNILRAVFIIIPTTSIAVTGMIHGQIMDICTTAEDSDPMITET